MTLAKEAGSDDSSTGGRVGTMTSTAFSAPSARLAGPGLAGLGTSTVEHRRLGILFGFEARVGGRLVALPSNVERLLAFLALKGRPHRRLSVASSLWIDSPQDRAAANLRTALWKARGALGDWVESRGAYLSLSPTVNVDVWRLVTQAKRLLDADAELHPHDDDSSVLVGDLLPDWDEDWVLFERERLRQLRIHALESLCSKLSMMGRDAEAIEAGLAAVEAEPLRESAHRTLIAAHLREGNVCEAHRQYRSYSELVRDAFGIEPSETLRVQVGLA
jgi:DNA-binding SARP family transcriptional activator